MQRDKKLEAFVMLRAAEASLARVMLRPAGPKHPGSGCFTGPSPLSRSRLDPVQHDSAAVRHSEFLGAG